MSSQSKHWPTKSPKMERFQGTSITFKVLEQRNFAIKSRKKTNQTKKTIDKKIPEKMDSISSLWDMRKYFPVIWKTSAGF